MMSLQHLYVIYTGKIMLVEAVQDLIRSDDFSAEFAKLKADLLGARDKYFFSEFDVNNLGYWMIELKRVDDAILLFELAAELYPDSWNAYDSLAEGWYRKGEQAEGAGALSEVLGAESQQRERQEVHRDDREGAESLTAARVGESAEGITAEGARGSVGGCDRSHLACGLAARRATGSSPGRAQRALGAAGLPSGQSALQGGGTICR